MGEKGNKKARIRKRENRKEENDRPATYGRANDTCGRAAPKHLRAWPPPPPHPGSAKTPQSTIIDRETKIHIYIGGEDEAVE